MMLWATATLCFMISFGQVKSLSSDFQNLMKEDTSAGVILPLITHNLPQVLAIHLKTSMELMYF